jgi:putative protease
MLSRFLNNRSANRGLCVQPCRWEYAILEVGRDEELTIGEDKRGTFILNSRDLCLIEHIPALAAAGVDSIKIEGRMKTAYYVAATTRVYRAALDRFSLEGSNYRNDPEWVNELSRVSHRPYSTGFYLPETGNDQEYMEDSSYIRNYDFVGVIVKHNTEKNMVKVSARNMFKTGDTLEVLDYNYSDIIKFEIKRITDSEKGINIDSAHNGFTVDIIPREVIKGRLSENALVRRIISL